MYWWREIDKLLYVTLFCDYVASYLCAVITEIVLLFAPTLFFAKPPFPPFYSYRINVHTFLPKKAIIVVFHVSRSFKSGVCATYNSVNITEIQ